MLALIDTASYLLFVNQLADSFRTSSPRSVTLTQLYFPLLAVVSSQEYFHPQDLAHAGRTHSPRLTGEDSLETVTNRKHISTDITIGHSNCEWDGMSSARIGSPQLYNVVSDLPHPFSEAHNKDCHDSALEQNIVLLILPTFTKKVL